MVNDQAQFRLPVSTTQQTRGGRVFSIRVTVITSCECVFMALGARPLAPNFFSKSCGFEALLWENPYCEQI